jgi:hypothetical protein
VFSLGSHDIEHRELLRRLRFYPLPVTTLPTPTAAITGQRVTYNNLDYYCDGTNWLSVQLFPADFDLDQAKPIVTGAVAGTAYATSRVTIPEQPLLPASGGILLVTTVLTLLETSANAHTATNYFDWTIQYTTAAGGVSAALTLGGTANTQGQGA